MSEPDPPTVRFYREFLRQHQNTFATCLNPACECHRIPAHRVMTPFPALNPVDIHTYCCNLCHSIRSQLPLPSEVPSV